MDNIELFARKPVKNAVLTLVVPSVISQLITVVYNMADTFYIGQLNDPVQVAAATVSMPPFLFLTGIANLFGIGGASLISRNLGEGGGRAKNCSAFAIWGAALTAMLYGLLFMALRPCILPLIGTTPETYGLSYEYMFWTVTIGAVPTVLSTVLAHLMRTEGYAKAASFGLAMGGILNMVLDPLFIFGFDMEIKGAAIATMLSNVIAFCYYAALVRIRRRQVHITFHPRYITLAHQIPKEILLVGLPGFLMTLMSFFSNTMLNQLVSGYSNEAVAGMGIAKKVDMIGFAVAQGMTQGVLPLIGYNYAAGNKKRVGETMKTTILYSVGIVAIGSVTLFVFASPISGLFIRDQETIAYSRMFIRTLCLSLPLSSVIMTVITVFQATGKKVQPTILSLLRKGGLDVPFMLAFNGIAQVRGIAWATPVADVMTLTVSLLLFVPYWRRLARE